MENSLSNDRKIRHLRDRSVRKSRTENSKRKMQRRKRGNSSLTIKEVAEHTGKIILDSAFNLADWIERIKQLAEPQYQISDSYFEDDSVSSFNDNYNVTENNCNRLNKTTRLILAKT